MATAVAGNKFERGLSMIEILITILVVSIGLLGLAGLQFAGLRAANSAQEHTYASLLAQDIEERIRANPGITYDALSIAASTDNCVDPPTSTPCAVNEMRSFDGSQWYYMLNSGGDNTPVLSNASIAISRSGNNYTVTITWGIPAGLRA